MELSKTSRDSLLKSLTDLIPGYGNFAKQEERREVDRHVRQYLSQRLQHCKQVLDQLLQAQLDRGELDSITEGQRLRDRIDLIQERIKAAVEGYSGWFDAKQVDEETLDKVYQLDSNLIGMTDKLATALADPTSPIPTRTGPDLLAAEEVLAELTERFNRRRELLESGN